MEACLEQRKTNSSAYAEKLKLRKTKRTYLFLVTLYKLLMDALYVNCIAQDYAYYGLDCSVNGGKIFLGYAFFIFVLFFTVKHILSNRSSDKMMFFFELMYFIPGITFHTYSTSEMPFLWFFIGFYFLFQIANALAKKIVKEKSAQESKRVSRVKKTIFSILVVALLAFTVFYLFYYNGFKIKFDFNNVYDIRLEMSKIEIPTIIEYIKNPTGILIPILIFLCLKKKKFITALLLTIIQLAMYGFGANKIHLLSAGVAIALAIVNKKHVYYWILIGLSAFLLFGVFYYSANHTLDKLTDILIRRTMFTPHKMCHDYFTCFSVMEPDYWRSSFLRYFGYESPYGQITYFIGIYNGTLSNCDNGLVGDAFGNFGYYSLFIYPFLYLLLFISYNIMCRGIKKELVIFLSFIYAVVFYDSPFFTVLLTHGYLFMFILFTFLYPYKNNVESECKVLTRETINQKTINNQVHTRLYN